jgi:hypothetical protein
MNTLEIIVLIFAILTIAKATLFIFLKQKPMLKMVEKVSKYTNVFSVVIAIGIIALGYLLLTQMSIVQVFAGVILGVGMMGLFFIQYPKSMTAMFKEMMKRKGAIFIGFFFFLVLSVWVIIDLFI